MPGTVSVGNAAIEIDRIKQEQMKVQENVALIYNFEDWGTYSCCFRKCCPCRGKDEKTEEEMMTKWFKKMYYDPTYQAQTKAYFSHIRFSGRPNTNKYTGGQMKGNTKKTTQEQLDYVAEQLAAKVKRAQVELAAAKAAAEANKEADAKKKAEEKAKTGEEIKDGDVEEGPRAAQSA